MAILGVSIAIAQTIVWFFPVKRELDVAAYRLAEWDVEAPIEVSVADARQVFDDFGEHGAYLAAVWDLKASSQDSTLEWVRAYVSPQPSDTRYSFYPSGTLLHSSGSSPDDWVDLDATAAAALHAQPGDDVAVHLNAETSVMLRVRSVYAVTGLYETGTISAPAEPLFAALPEVAETDEMKMMNILHVRGMSRTQVEDVLSGEFYAERFERGGYYPDGPDVASLGVASRQERLVAAGEIASIDAGFVVIAGVVGGAAVLAISLWESLGLIRRGASTDLRVLRRLGAPNDQVWFMAGAWATFAATGGIALGTLAGFGGVAWVSGVSAFSPSLTGIYWGAAGTLLALVLACVWVATGIEGRSRRSL
jgi:hypothetical protein